jgi:hypothetical protein
LQNLIFGFCKASLPKTTIVISPSSSQGKGRERLGFTALVAHFETIFIGNSPHNGDTAKPSELLPALGQNVKIALIFPHDAVFGHGVHALVIVDGVHIRHDIF